MDKKFESLLKTDEKVASTQPSDDVLKYPKSKIKRICRAMCLSAVEYDPQKTVSAIDNYLKEKACKERILYSEISSYVYGLSADEQGNFATNIEFLLAYSFEKSDTISKDVCKIIIKIYDHFQLAVKQKALNSETNDAIKAYLSKSINEAQEEIELAAKNAKNMEKEYITILGIFASVVLAFVGGLTFSTSVLQNINAVSVYRLLLVADGIAMVVINSIALLMKFICRINDKQLKGVGVIWFNIIFGIIGIVIIAAWVLDLNSLIEYLGTHLPWVK